MKEAEWALRPSTEGEIAEEKRRHVARRRVGWALAISTVGLCPLSLFGLLLTIFERGPASYVFVPLLALALVGAEYGRHCGRADRYARARLATIREEYADLHGWLAEICVLQGAAPTGFDQGVLWFEDDRLMFLGERTSFALSTGSVHERYREHWGVRGLLSTTSLPLRVRTSGGDVVVGIDVIADYVPGQPYRGLEGFRKALRGWLSAGHPGEGQMPPLSLGPGIASSGALLRGALCVSFAWAMLTALTGALLYVSGPVALVVIAFFSIVLLACPELWTLRLRWQAWRDRRRLDLRGG